MGGVHYWPPTSFLGGGACPPPVADPMLSIVSFVINQSVSFRIDLFSRLKNHWFRNSNCRNQKLLLHSALKPVSESSESGALSLSSAARYIDFHLLRRIYVAYIAHSVALSLHNSLSKLGMWMPGSGSGPDPKFVDPIRAFGAIGGPWGGGHGGHPPPPPFWSRFIIDKQLS